MAGRRTTVDEELDSWRKLWRRKIVRWGTVNAGKMLKTIIRYYNRVHTDLVQTYFSPLVDSDNKIHLKCTQFIVHSVKIMGYLIGHWLGLIIRANLNKFGPFYLTHWKKFWFRTKGFQICWLAHLYHQIKVF